MTDPHPLDYLEIAAPDVEGAKRFYTAAFGWGFIDYGPGYAAIVAGDGGEAGGLNAEGTPGAGGVLALVRSADLDATYEAVLGAGGEAVEPPYDYPGGRRFVFRDPAGNVLGVYQPAG